MHDLAAIFDAHVRAEFQDLDLEATMATMTDDPYVHHVPTITVVGFEGGQVGHEHKRALALQVNDGARFVELHDRECGRSGKMSESSGSIRRTRERFSPR